MRYGPRRHDRTKTLKAGAKIKGIRLVDRDHDVDCKVDGMGVLLKSKFLKKA
jgi:protein PhnA